MARWLGMAFVALTVGFLLSAADAQDTGKEARRRRIFKKLDTNKDGVLSKDEFLKLADNFKNKDQAREKLTKAFELIDKDMKGLSITQFKTYLEKCEKEEGREQVTIRRLRRSRDPAKPQAVHHLFPSSPQHPFQRLNRLAHALEVRVNAVRPADRRVGRLAISFAS